MNEQLKSRKVGHAPGKFSLGHATLRATSVRASPVYRVVIHCVTLTLRYAKVARVNDPSRVRASGSTFMQGVSKREVCPA